MITPEQVYAKRQEMLMEAAEIHKQEAARARPARDRTLPRTSTLSVGPMRIPLPSVNLDWVPFL